MAEIVNLRRARKERARGVKEAQASENRARFGRPKHETVAERANRTIEARTLDGHRRETGGDAEQ